MNFLSVNDFEVHQHYKTRRPPWIKQYVSRLDDYAFGKLPDVAKGHLQLIELLASKLDNKIPDDPKWIGQQIGALEPVDVELLISQGFLKRAPYDSKELAPCAQSACTETEGEKEREKESATGARARVENPVDNGDDEDLSVSAFSNRLITALNQGMMDNRKIGDAMNPVPHGHGKSLEAAEKLRDAKVPLLFASSVVYEMAAEYEPSGRNRQIKSVAYCADAVIERWEQDVAERAASGSTRPAVQPSRRGGKRNAGEENFERANRALDGIAQ